MSHQKGKIPSEIKSLDIPENPDFEIFFYEHASSKNLCGFDLRRLCVRERLSSV